tara:strand:+ start:2884 stop:3285 length:402 start_codon:yes stop_codon:yes gene_type:complete
VTGITLIAVAAGGACGALLRYGAVLATGAGIFGFAGPMATLTVNISGSAMMGLVAGGLAAGVVMPEPLRLFIAVGFLGALTTFSTFALDAGALLQRQSSAVALAYIALLVVLSLLAFAAAHMLASAALGRGAS